MSHEVIWTQKVLDNFIIKGNLNAEQEYIMRSRCENVPISAQAMHLHCSESTVHRQISKIKKIYDAVQAEHPDDFPARRSSAKETYMDTH